MNEATQDPMKIVRLTASNFMRLSAVEIVPDPDASTVVISGKNGAGKSAVLNSIAIAVGGAKAVSLLKPIKDGEESAEVTVETEDLIITRRWTKNGPGTLSISDRSGRTYKRPQEFLYGLIGDLSFDALKFANASPKDQLAMLLDVVDIGIDLEKNAEERKAAYEQRTDVNRRAKDRKAQITALAPLPQNLPGEETPATEALEAYQVALNEQREHDKKRDDITTRRGDIDRLQEQVATIERYVADLLPEVEGFEEKDIEALKATADGVEEINKHVREFKRRAEIKAEYAALDKESKGLTLDIESLDKDKADALAAAQMPVDGLSFDDEGVTYRGIPFAQASQSEQLRASIGLGMAANPNFRVMPVQDASLLDAENMGIIEEMAKEHDFQVWLEVVADTSGGVGIVIEDGSVKDANP